MIRFGPWAGPADFVGQPIHGRSRVPSTGSRFVMPWGKYRGVPIEEIPDAYLAWGLIEADLYGAVRAAFVDEWSRRAGRRRSWRPVVKAKWGRRLLDASGQGPFAVVQPCGGFGLWTVWLSPTLEQAREKRQDDCGWDGGPGGCEPECPLRLQLARPVEVPGEAIE